MGEPRGADIGACPVESRSARTIAHHESVNCVALALDVGGSIGPGLDRTQRRRSKNGDELMKPTGAPAGERLKAERQEECSKLPETCRVRVDAHRVRGGTAAGV